MYSYSTVRSNVVHKIGHRFTPCGVSTELKDKGLSCEAIVQELLEIEIELWKVYRDQLKEN